MKKTTVLRILSFIALSLVTLLLLSFIPPPSNTNADGRLLEGVWYNTDKTGKIDIQKEEDEFFGTIVWLDEPLNESGKPKTDDENPDKALRSRPIIGLEVIYGFTYEGDNIYSGGKIYDPENGKTYKCRLTLLGDQLDVRGYIGIPALGRTEHWTRVE